MPENKGLYSKYHVRTPDENPLDSGTVVLRPFNSDGSVRDISAVNALTFLAADYRSRGMNEFAGAIFEWLDNPVGHEATKNLNVPG